MIALAASAAAADLAVDVLAMPVVAHTAAVSAWRERVDVSGLTSDRRVWPRASGIGGRGAAIQVSGALDPAATRWVAELGARVENPTWGVANLPFRPVAVSSTAEIGGLVWMTGRPVSTDGYVVLLTGVQVSAMDAGPYAPLLAAPAWAGSAAVGGGTRTGRARLRAECRLDFAARSDQFEGRAQLVDSTFTWRWFPGSASASLVLGAGLGPR